MDNIRSSRGFTLIEIAIVMVISSSLLMGAISFYKVQKELADHEKTIDTIEITQSAIFEFYGLNGRYPCPADPSLAITDLNFGIERCRPALLAPALHDCIANMGLISGANLECLNFGSRDLDGNGTGETVIMGMVPVTTIFNSITETNFTVSNMTDAYNMRISYAVTEAMTDQNASVVNPVSSEIGVIRIDDENGTSVIQPDNSAHLVIFSHGRNKVGGYSRAGVLINDCSIPSGMWAGAGPAPPPPPGPIPAGVKKDKENCDRNDAIFIKALNSASDTDDYYDDVLFFTINATQDLWKRSFLSPSTGSFLYNTNIGNVGIGTSTPTTKLHVNGDINAKSAIASDQYCDLTQSDCLIPEAIGGVGSACPDGQAVYGMENNAVVCQDVFTVVPTATCPAGTFLNGFSNLGNIRCCDASNACTIYP